jgi:hypothetical protein
MRYQERAIVEIIHNNRKINRVSRAPNFAGMGDSVFGFTNPFFFFVCAIFFGHSINARNIAAIGDIYLYARHKCTICLGHLPR